MKIFAVTQEYWRRGDSLPKAKVIGLVVADDPESARKAIPKDVILGPDWFAYEPKLHECGDLSRDALSPSFFAWSDRIA